MRGGGAHREVRGPRGKHQEVRGAGLDREACVLLFKSEEARDHLTMIACGEVAFEPFDWSLENALDDPHAQVLYNLALLIAQIV